MSVRHGFLREVALVAAAMLAYFGIRNGTVGGADEAYANAARIADFEQWLRVAWEDAVQDTVLDSNVLVTLTNWIYIWGHWPVILGVAAALYLYRRERYYLLRNALVVSGAIGFVFFAALPVAPPRLVDPGLVDTVTNESSAYRALQPPGLTNQYAAFPSLHVGWNVVVGIVLLMTTAHLAVRAFAVISPLAMGFAVIATANHFVLDVVSGVAVVIAGIVVALAIEKRNAPATLDGSGSAARLDDEPRRASPFLVAHRAGNRLVDLKAAEELGVALVEADVRLYRGKLEVRHLKTVGPLPILWDRWELAAPWRPRLLLHDLLAATAPETELLLDLKGPRARLGKRVLDAIRPYLPDRRFTLCARRSALLEPFTDVPVRCVHSVGNARQLRRLRRRFSGKRLDGVSIHEQLLDRDSVASLRGIAAVIMTWPVNRPERARELLRLGIDGLISDDVAGLASAGVLEATA